MTNIQHLSRFLIVATSFAGLSVFSMAPMPSIAAEQPKSSDPKVKAILKDKFWVTMPNQKYALCAGAVTFNFDGITYARCKMMNGNSISLKHSYPGGNIQTVNDIGNAPGNGAFMVSTYSPPDPAEIGVYSCKKGGAFAQCDGGLCFTNTTGKNFPGLGRLSGDEIICSCPIVPSKNYYVYGPAQCPTSQSDYDQVCGAGKERKVTSDGYSLRIGELGPPATVVAQNAFYDKVFKTSNGTKVCEPPSSRK